MRLALGAVFLVVARLAGAQAGYALQTIGNPPSPNFDFGSRIAAVGDVDGDSVADYLVGDPAAAIQYTQVAGEARLVSGATGGTIRSHYGHPWSGPFNPNGVQGAHLAGVGDVNLDGVPDYVTAIPDYLGGEVKVWSGASGAALFTFAGTVTQVSGLFFSELLGTGLCGPGDVTGDGVPDVVLGAPNAGPVSYPPPAPTNMGRIVICSGATGATSTVPGALPGSKFGEALCGPGDLDGDGISDIVVGAPGSGYVQAYAGVTGAIVWTTNAGQPGFGSVLAPAGDFDGDGVNDVIVGAPAATVLGMAGAGQAFILSGATGAQLFAISGTAAGEGLGTRVSKAGDLDGDGYGDILVGSPGAPPSSAGKVQIVMGPTGASIQTLSSATPSDNYGTGVAGGILVDADGVPDLLVGAIEAGPGRVVAISGATLSTIYQLHGAAAPFSAPESPVDAGDQDGDGAADLAFGSSPANIVLVSNATGQVIRVLPAPPSPIVARLGDVDGDGSQDFAAVTGSLPSSVGPVTITLNAVSGASGAFLYTTTWTRCFFFGVRMIAPGDFDGDGIKDIVVAVFGGASPTCPPAAGFIEVRSGATGALIAPIPGSAAVAIGSKSLDALGDVDGDGVVDFIVGSPWVQPSQFSADGLVQAYSGATLAPIFSIPGFANQLLGSSVAGIGDVNGDGIPDLAAASMGAGSAAIYSGAGGAFLGNLLPPAGSPAVVSLTGVGDVNGDGIPDVAVGVPQFSVPGVSQAGAVFAFSGTGPWPMFTSFGAAAGEGFGAGVARIGDWNRDGLADVWAGSGQIARGQILSFAGVPAGSTAIGTGCLLASGRAPSLAAFGGDPTSAAGNPAFGLIVSNGGAGSPGALAAGFSTSSWNGVPLPLALGPGFPGCSLYVSVDALVPFVLGTGLGGLGAVTFPVPVPANPALAGATLSFQAYVASSPLSALPGAVTPALTIVVQ